MEETDDFIDEPDCPVQVEETRHLLCAFGDDVARRYLRLRGIHTEAMQEAVLERHALRAPCALPHWTDAVAQAA
jgi:hypothetical protein